MNLNELYRLYRTGKTSSFAAYLMARCEKLWMESAYVSRPFIGPIGKLP